jgi:hypothetical protein
MQWPNKTWRWYKSQNRQYNGQTKQDNDINHRTDNTLFDHCIVCSVIYIIVMFRLAIVLSVLWFISLSCFICPLYCLFCDLYHCPVLFVHCIVCSVIYIIVLFCLAIVLSVLWFTSVLFHLAIVLSVLWFISLSCFVWPLYCVFCYLYHCPVSTKQNRTIM